MEAVQKLKVEVLGAVMNCKSVKEAGISKRETRRESMGNSIKCSRSIPTICYEYLFPILQ